MDKVIRMVLLYIRLNFNKTEFIVSIHQNINGIKIIIQTVNKTNENPCVVIKIIKKY